MNKEKERERERETERESERERERECVCEVNIHMSSAYRFSEPLVSNEDYFGKEPCRSINADEARWTAA